MGVAVSALADRVDFQKDRNSYFALGALILIASELRRRQLAKKWREKRNSNDGEKYELSFVVDHPLFGYLLENLSLLGISISTLSLFPKLEANNFKRNVVLLFFMGMFNEEGMMLWKSFVAKVIYAHRPWFSHKLDNHVDSVFDLSSKYVRCNLVILVVNALTQSTILSNLPAERFNASLDHKTNKLRLLPYLTKYFLARMVVDLSFYAAHRGMHESPTMYKHVHSLHHEHRNPRILTSAFYLNEIALMMSNFVTDYNFEALDLWIEAVLPTILVNLTFEVLGVRSSMFETVLMSSSLLTFEIGSHTGKNVDDSTSWFPLLTPIVNAFCPNDMFENTTLYHTRHHQFAKKNFSISPWVDWFLGSYEINPPAWQAKES